MTRFARARGSKADNSKTPENPSSWVDLKVNIDAGQASGEDQCSNDPCSNKVSTALNQRSTAQSTSSWAVFEEPKENSIKKNKRKYKTGISEKKIEDTESQKNCSDLLLNSANELVFGRYVTEANKLKLKKLKDELVEKGIPPNEIKKTIEFEKRKMLKSFKKKNCFNCRKDGHLISECPELKEKSKVTVCYTCGSTEHRASRCKSRKNNNNKFAFATCFICKEEGHISTECPDNPCGLYSMGGGCKECGDVTHFSKNCPRLVAKQEKNRIFLQKINPRNLEGLGDDIHKLPTIQPKKKCKIVKF